MAKTLLLGFIAAAIPALSAQAAPATPDEAARLTALFERYVGHPAAGEPASVSVAPEGDSYRVTLDLERATAGLGSFGFSLDPYVTTTIVTPLADGTWKVTSDGSPLLVIHAGQQTISFKSATSTLEGIYDPKVYGFRTLTQSQTGSDYAQTTPTFTQDRRTDKLSLTLTGTPEENDRDSMSGHYAVTGTAATMLIKPAVPPATGPGTDASANRANANDSGANNPALTAPAEPGTPLSYTTPNGTIDVSLDHLHNKDLLDLWAFLVAHPDRNSLAAAQDELRNLLRAGLPFLASLKENASFDSFALTTTAGVFTAKTLAGAVSADNLAATGGATGSLSLDGLTVPAGQLPAWSIGLVPTRLALNLAIEGFHAEEAATEAVNDFDLRNHKSLTKEQSDTISHLFWPGGGTVTLAPSRLTTGLLDLKLDGQATLGGVPKGRITVSGTGLDKAIAALQAASGTDPGASQVLGLLVLAKNLAKPNSDGSLTWVIEAGNGPVTVNGAPLQ